MADPVFATVETVEEARSLMTELTEQVELAREQSDLLHDLGTGGLPGPDGKPVTYGAVRTAFTNWAIRYGRAMGTLATLMHCRRLNDVAYNELRARVVSTGVPKVSPNTFKG